MITYNRICIKNYEIKDGDIFLVLERGKEYRTSAEKEGTVTVFSKYWAYGIPVEIFAGEIRKT